MIAREMLPAAMQEVLAVTLMHRGIDPASVAWIITQQEIERAMRGPDELIGVVREHVEKAMGGAAAVTADGESDGVSEMTGADDAFTQGQALAVHLMLGPELREHSRLRDRVLCIEWTEPVKDYGKLLDAWAEDVRRDVENHFAKCQDSRSGIQANGKKF